MITEIAFTGTPVTDIKRAREFYESVLGFKPSMESAGGMWIEYTIGQGTFAIGCYGEGVDGIVGGVISPSFAIGCYGDQWKPSKDGTGIAFEVDDFDAEVARLKSLGVKFSLEPMPTPICHFAIISDPDGNNIFIHKRKEK